jgi:hypothetical protein
MWVRAVAVLRLDAPRTSRHLDDYVRSVRSIGDRRLPDVARLHGGGPSLTAPIPQLASITAEPAAVAPLRNERQPAEVTAARPDRFRPELLLEFGRIPLRSVAIAQSPLVWAQLDRDPALNAAESHAALKPKRLSGGR